MVTQPPGQRGLDLAGGGIELIAVAVFDGDAGGDQSGIGIPGKRVLVPGVPAKGNQGFSLFAP